MPQQKINWDSIDTITEPMRTAIHTALDILSGRCDGAYAKDNAGFNKYDADIGNDLAESGILTDKQARLAKKILFKYHRQIPDELWDVVYEGQEKP
jgi:hypothetical protein